MKFLKCNRKCTFLEWKWNDPKEGQEKLVSAWCRKTGFFVREMKECPGKDVRPTQGLGEDRMRYGPG